MYLFMGTHQHGEECTMTINFVNRQELSRQFFIVKSEHISRVLGVEYGSVKWNPIE